MKRLAILALTLVFAAGSIGALAMDVPDSWLKDLDKAKEKAMEENKPVLAVFSAAWCPPCNFAAENIYPQPEVSEELEKWVAVYVDTEEYPELEQGYGIIGIPTYVILNPDGKEETRFGLRGDKPVEGFLEPLRNYTIYKVDAAELKERLKAEPENADLHKELGDLAMKAGRKTEALEEYKQAILLSDDQGLDLPDSFRRMVMGRIEFENARNEINEQLREKPNDPLLLKKRADILLPNGYLFDPRIMEQAVGEYLKAAEVDEKNETGAKWLGEFWLEFVQAEAMPSLDDVPAEHRQAMENYGDAVRSMINKGPEVGYRMFSRLADNHPDSIVEHSARWFEKILKSIAQE